jgi:hypothetical protein
MDDDQDPLALERKLTAYTKKYGAERLWGWVQDWMVGDDTWSHDDPERPDLEQYLDLRAENCDEELAWLQAGG